jgi:hypothetical protein
MSLLLIFSASISEVLSAQAFVAASHSADDLSGCHPQQNPLYEWRCTRVITCAQGNAIMIAGVEAQITLAFLASRLLKHFYLRSRSLISSDCKKKGTASFLFIFRPSNTAGCAQLFFNNVARRKTYKGVKSCFLFFAHMHILKRGDTWKEKKIAQLR